MLLLEEDAMPPHVEHLVFARLMPLALALNTKLVRETPTLNLEISLPERCAHATRWRELGR